MSPTTTTFSGLPISLPPSARTGRVRGRPLTTQRLYTHLQSLGESPQVVPVRLRAPANPSRHVDSASPRAVSAIAVLSADGGGGPCPWAYDSSHSESKEASMQCTACGRGNPPEARFCQACGAMLTASTPRPHPVSPSPVARLGDRLLAVILDTLLLAVVFAVVGMWAAGSLGGRDRERLRDDGKAGPRHDRRRPRPRLPVLLGVRRRCSGPPSERPSSGSRCRRATTAAAE